MKYRYLLFDADQTLFDYNKAQRQALTSIMDTYGFPKEEEVYKYFHSLNDGLWKQLEKGELTRDELLNTRFVRFFEAYGVSYPGPGIVEEHYINALSQGCFLLPDAEMVCGRLSRHFHLSLVTNGITRAQNGRLDKSGLRPYFQHIFISEEVGADKPSEAFFDKVYETLGCPDKESMMIIGDSLSSDIRGGVNFGIHTCHVVLDGDIPEYKEIQPTYTIKELKELFTILYEQPVETE